MPAELETPAAGVDFRHDERFAGLRRFLAASPAAVTLANPRLPDCPLIFTNTAFERLTGYSEVEVLGRNCRFLQGAATERTAIAACRDAVEQRVEAEICFLNYRSDGRAFDNLLLLHPVSMKGGLDLILGCQHEIPAAPTVTHFEERSEQLSEVVNRMRSASAKLSQTREDIYRMRSDRVMGKVKTYLQRQSQF